MPTSDTTIANRALRILKAQRIDSLTDGSPNANVLIDIFDQVREDLLRAHTWRFARKFAKLARLSTTPILEYNYAYALPSDFVRVVSVHDNDNAAGRVNNYEEGEQDDVGVIFASVEDVYIKYVYLLTDPNRMPPDFRTAFAFELALQAPGIPNLSGASQELLDKRARKRLMRAKSADSLGSPSQPRPAGSWATSRHVWPSSTWPRP